MGAVHTFYKGIINLFATPSASIYRHLSASGVLRPHRFYGHIEGKRELFKTILDEEGLRFDREGQLWTTYSLRHTYMCLRLMEGADIYQIASLVMIEKYYAAPVARAGLAPAVDQRSSRRTTKFG